MRIRRSSAPGRANMPRKTDFTGIICCKCGSDKTYVRPSGRPEWYRHYDKEGNWDWKSWLCHKCYMKKQNYLPGSHQNIQRDFARIRIGQLSIDKEKGKSTITEAVVQKARRCKSYNIDTDNFNSEFDLYLDPEYNIIQVKSATYSHIYGWWSFKGVNVGNADNVFLVCMDNMWNNVEKMYVVPKETIEKRIKHDSGITIAKNPSRISQYFEFEISAKPYNDAYHSLIAFLKNRKYFGIEDIKKWLS